MNLLISKEGIVLGQTLSPENAHRHAMISRTELYVVTDPKDFSNLPKECVRGLNADHGAKSFRGLWTALSKKTFPYWGKVSVKKIMRHLYEDKDTALTHDELLATVPGASWISITTALSMLKNKKYADGDVLVIAQDSEGKYRRRK